MKTNKLLIIGGVAAGASCAARARRLCESAEITIIERGPDVSFANCGLPYHIGGEIPNRDVLAVQTPESLKGLLNLDVRTQCDAISIDRSNKRVEVRNLVTGQSEWLSYDKLMLAPGASPLRPPLPGIDDQRIFTLRNLQDMDRIVEATATGMRAVVIGAGFIGLEMAEQLHRKG
ncbi:MAG: FAD-dependent oxidoreductase [Betaproteobacteria bacterium]